jgi:hypothetical protein
MSFVDVIIVGSGISGLYSAYTIKKKSPETSFLILEKYKKNWIGGRTSNDHFYGSEIVTGAGIGRKNKDKLLYSLLKEFHLPTQDFKIHPKIFDSEQSVNIVEIIQHLKNEYNHHKDKMLTFKEFAKPVLGEEKYKKFILSVGYTDYENEDAFETLFHYGMEDNTCCWTGFRVPWKQLVNKLYDFIGNEHFKFSKKVVSIQEKGESLCVFTENGKIYSSNKIIIASTIDTVRQLLPHPIYRSIEGQPFLRLYAKFTKKSSLLLKNYIQGMTYVSTSLQRIIPMDSENGIYMIAYNDNKNAIALKNRLENIPENRTFYERLLEKSLHLPDNSLELIALKDFYWKIGTHYYKPLNKKIHKSREDFIYEAQHPTKNILVVGELISLNQGWVEGALESVKSVVTKRWITV